MTWSNADLTAAAERLIVEVLRAREDPLRSQGAVLSLRESLPADDALKVAAAAMMALCVAVDSFGKASPELQQVLDEYADRVEERSERRQGDSELGTPPATQTA